MRGRSEVFLSIESETGEDLLLVAPSVPISRFVENVFLPDGRPVTAVRSDVEAQAEAVPAANPDHPDEWRSVPVHVKIECEGHELLELDGTVDGDHPRRTLVRR